MSFVDQLKPDGKEIEIGNKKYTQDTKITFNMKAFISLIIIIGGLFATTYFLCMHWFCFFVNSLQNIFLLINPSGYKYCVLFPE